MKKLLLGALILSASSLCAVVNTPTTKPITAPSPQATPPQNAPPPPPVVRPLISPQGKTPTQGRPLPKTTAPSDAEVAAPTNVTFTLPGIIGMQEGEWKGTDDLLNLKSDIYVSVDIVAPKDMKLPFTSDSLKSHIEANFTKANLHPDTPPTAGNPPLPYLHFVVMTQPCGDESAAFIQVRLFEKVKLDRVVLPNEVTYQAITWEDENFLVMSRSDLKAEVMKQIDEMTDYFVSRFNFFEKETFRTK